jgi:hypothetical protein
MECKRNRKGFPHASMVYREYNIGAIHEDLQSLKAAIENILERQYIERGLL